MSLEDGPTMEAMELKPVGNHSNIRVMTYQDPSGAPAIIVIHPMHRPCVMVGTKDGGWTGEVIVPEFVKDEQIKQEWSEREERNDGVKVERTIYPEDDEKHDLDDCDCSYCRAVRRDRLNRSEKARRAHSAERKEMALYAERDKLAQMGVLEMPAEEMDRLREQSMKDLCSMKDGPDITEVSRQGLVRAELQESRAMSTDDAKEGPTLQEMLALATKAAMPHDIIRAEDDKPVDLMHGGLTYISGDLRNFRIEGQLQPNWHDEYDLRYKIVGTPKKLNPSTPDEDEPQDEEQRVNYLSDSDSSQPD